MHMKSSTVFELKHWVEHVYFELCQWYVNGMNEEIK